MSWRLSFNGKLFLTAAGMYLAGKALEEYAEHRDAARKREEDDQEGPASQEMIKRLIAAASKNNRELFRQITEQIGDNCPPDVLQKIWESAGGKGTI